MSDTTLDTTTVTGVSVYDNRLTTYVQKKEKKRKQYYNFHK